MHTYQITKTECLVNYDGWKNGTEKKCTSLVQQIVHSYDGWKMEQKEKVQPTCTTDCAQWILQLHEPYTMGLPFRYASFVITERNCAIKE